MQKMLIMPFLVEISFAYWNITSQASAKQLLYARKLLLDTHNSVTLSNLNSASFSNPE